MSEHRAVTIGAFDGVHLGHAALIRQARAAAGDAGRVTALAFEPHPLRVLRPEAAPPRLSSFQQRREWLAALGADDVVALRPTAELLGLAAEAFLESIVGDYAPAAVVEGRDFRFGRGRGGSVETIEREARRLGYRAIIVDDVEAALVDGSAVRVSSSLVRWLVARGRVRDAARLLGRPYELRGRVVPGDGRGGPVLGIRTANLETGELLPADGIYIGTAEAGGATWPAAVSVGTKPTFGENPRTCEAHLIGDDPPADEYGWTMRLLLHDWLRDQLSYSSVEALVDQIHRDIARVKAAAGHQGELAEAPRS